MIHYMNGIKSIRLHEMTWFEPCGAIIVIRLLTHGLLFQIGPGYDGGHTVKIVLKLF